MKLILLGPPGAGKGTQAEILSRKLNVKTISTGVMLRTAIREETELGKIASQYIEEGNLVPDDVMIGIVEGWLKSDDCQDGFILDGFPRTICQAESLDKTSIKIDKILSIELDDESVIKRLSGRRECKDCGAPYHILYNPSAKGEKCEKCGGELICRKDDSAETVKSRLAIYHKQTEPIKAYYVQQGNLVVAHGKEKIEDTTKEVFSALGIKE